MKWTNTKDKMPCKMEYVLIETPFCKYPATVGYWNGHNWRSIDDVCEIKNVDRWLNISIPKDSKRDKVFKANGQEI